MGKADLHIHTTASYDGTATPAATLEYVCASTDLDVIAITDHDAIDGSLMAKEMAARYGIDVITGIEVSTKDGHLLALFVDQIVPRNLTLQKTVEYIAEIGGLCVVPHPGGKWDGSAQEQTIRNVLASNELRKTLVGIETYNGSLPNLKTNCHAQEMNREFCLADVGNSDAHILWMIGKGWTTFAGRSASDLRTALVEGTTRAMNTQRSWRFYPDYLQSQLLRTAGVVRFSKETPGSKILLRWVPGMQTNLARQFLW